MDAQNARDNFWWMSLAFALNHSCATTALIYASTALDDQSGFTGNGILYVLTIVSSLWVAVPTVNALGLKSGLVVGFGLYFVYSAAFALAILVQSRSPIAANSIFFLGSGCGGLGAGMIWTAQGGYMSRTATIIADWDNDGEVRRQVTTELAGLFAFYYLLFEALAKLIFSFLLSLNFEIWHVGTLYSLLCLIAVGMMTRAGYIQASAVNDPQPAFYKVIALWREPYIWLLSPTNVTFGFSAAFMNGYLNMESAGAIGEGSIGALAAVTVISAAVLSRAYALLGQRCGKGLCICVGAVSFGCIPTFFLALRCCEGFGWWLIIFYILQGSGRAVYESTNKAVFSDFFKGDKTEGAFANCALQMSVASALCFFLSARLSGQFLCCMVLAAAIVTPVVYALAVALQQDESKDGASLPLNPIESGKN